MDASYDRVLEEMEERRIRLVHLWFTDVLGFLKSVAVPAGELRKAFAEGVGFDGSSIQGFARFEEADMLARPDPTTFRVLSEAEGAGAHLLCDIAYPDGVPFEGDPRQVLRRTLTRLSERGYRALLSPEVEFFLSRSGDRFDPADRAGYFDLTSAEVAERMETSVAEALEGSGVAVESLHHEGAPGQLEIDLLPTDAMVLADAMMMLRPVVKEVAGGLGLHASFMPKPAEGIEGSGMHTHVRLLEGDRNAMFHPDEGLSGTGLSFVAGLLRHAREITAVTNQWVNSYKRLVPGYEAPIYVCWARQNRSALVRVPSDRPKDEHACRIEYRAPDPACNPYLAFAVILAAGLAGIAEDLEPPPEALDDLAAMPDEEVRALGIGRLPDSLHEAVQLLERSELVAETLGERAFEWFVRNKREEWEAYRSRVTAFETERYFPLL